MSHGKNFGVIQKKLDADKKTSKEYRRFISAIKTESTTYRYQLSFDQFMRFAKISKYSKLKLLKTVALQDVLEDYVMSLSTQCGSSVASLFSAVKLFLGMNRIAYFPTPISKLFPSNNHLPAGKVPYTTQDIQWMLDVSITPRHTAIVLFFASTGVRPGGTQDEDGYLQIKHAIEMPDGNFNIKIYAGTRFEYDTFLTPEASDALRAYLSFRENKGHKLTPDSPLFATRDGKKPMSSANIEELVTRLVKGSPVKRALVRGNQHDKAIIYGFRKRFNTILKIDNDVNSNIAEKLMAHKRGLDGTYLQPTTQECYTEFKKAIPQLTISKLEQTKTKLAIAERKLGGVISREQIDMVFDLMQKTGVIVNGKKSREFMDSMDDMFSKD